ncbi:MAG: N-acetyl-gamma-glutamyl-phosphate reductase [Candidatus Promineifilaceae bacterium]
MDTVKAGVYGATGYTGYELITILERHPQVEIAFATSQTYAGQSLRQVFSGAQNLMLSTPDDVSPGQADVVFLCLPHAASAETAVLALDAGAKVIDLSADFRFTDVDVYEAWYKVKHPAPQLLPHAVYGLTEFARDALRHTRLVANPGCYTTTTLLALQPLMASQAAVQGAIIVDAKSGVSGAGRTPRTNTLFVEVANNFSPYSIGRSHRHLPEMEQVMAWWHNDAPPLIFSPHLLPVPRGILATIYVTGFQPWSEAEVRGLYADTYASEPFVEVLPAGELATLAHVVHSNRCVISLSFCGETLIITSATDNLVKGASGQAVQNMNVMLGFPETMGLCAS